MFVTYFANCLLLLTHDEPGKPLTFVERTSILSELSELRKQLPTQASPLKHFSASSTQNMLLLAQMVAGLSTESPVDRLGGGWGASGEVAPRCASCCAQRQQLQELNSNHMHTAKPVPLL